MPKHDVLLIGATGETGAVLLRFGGSTAALRKTSDRPTISHGCSDGFRTLSSKRWASSSGWHFNGMSERLQGLVDQIDKSVLVRHAERVKGQKITLSEPYSAGQYWVWFELVAEDGSLIIARVRLPRHPETPSTVSEEDELYAIDCEVATMRFVERHLPTIMVPSVYAYEGPASKLAADLGAIYILIEGFYDNTLQDIESDICNLPIPLQKHVMTQWANTQVQLATLSSSKIGAISSISPSGEPIIGKLASATVEGLDDAGLFSTTEEYFTAIVNSAVHKVDANQGVFVFRDIVDRTSLFHDSPDDNSGNDRGFPLNHMDLGTQNILVDEELNFLVIIDWEFAQMAPWQVNHFPMPFPLLWSNAKLNSIRRNPDHVAYRNISRQDTARGMYCQAFLEAEKEVRERARPLGWSFSEALNSPASKTYACFNSLGRNPQDDADLIRVMVQLAFGLDGERAEEYLRDIERSSCT